MSFTKSVRGHVAGGLTLVVNRLGWKLLGVAGCEEREHDYQPTTAEEVQQAWDATAKFINTMTGEQFIQLFGDVQVGAAVDTAALDFHYALGGKAAGMKSEMFSRTVAGMDVLKMANTRDYKDARVLLRTFRYTLGLCPDETHLIEECMGYKCFPWRVGEYANGAGIWSDTTRPFDKDEAMVLEHFGIPGHREFFNRGMPMNLSDTYREMLVRR